MFIESVKILKLCLLTVNAKRITLCSRMLMKSEHFKKIFERIPSIGSVQKQEFSVSQPMTEPPITVTKRGEVLSRQKDTGKLQVAARISLSLRNHICSSTGSS